MQVAEEHPANFHVTLGALLPGVVMPASVAAIEVAGLVADSRRAKPGELFFAVPGLSLDGQVFIDAAVDAGVVAVICQDGCAGVEASLSWRGDVPVLGVADVRAVMAAAAATFYRHPSRTMTLAGVTGTNGKSTCVFLLAQLYQLLGQKSAVVGTLGYGCFGDTLAATGMTTPDAITSQRILRELADQQVRVTAMEVSSHALSQKRTAAVQFDTAIFTNISRDHLDYHGDMDSYAAAKAQLFQSDHLRHAAINLDDAIADRMQAAVKPGAQLWTYGLRNPSAQVYATRVDYDSAGIRALVRTPWGSGELHTRLLGEFNLYNLLAVITAVCAEGAAFARVLELVPQLTPVKGRMQTVDSESSINVIVDYAHTPDALQQVLRALRLHGQRKIHVVFGCGGDRDVGKRPQMAAVAEAFADHIVVTSDNPRTETRSKIIEDICRGFSSTAKVTVEVDRAAAIELAIQQAAPGDLVLLAGKGHEDYQIVGLERLPFDDENQARLALRKVIHGGGK